MPWIGIKAEFVAAAAKISDESVPGADHSCRAQPLETTHRSQRSLQSVVIGFRWR
jgi:hypothetical protein